MLKLQGIVYFNSVFNNFNIVGTFVVSIGFSLAILSKTNHLLIQQLIVRLYIISECV